MNKKVKLSKILYNINGYHIRHTKNGFGVYAGKKLKKNGFKNKQEIENYIRLLQ